LAFPGLFRAALDIKSKKITEAMKVAAAKGIANLIPEKSLTRDCIISNALDSKVIAYIKF